MVEQTTGQTMAFCHSSSNDDFWRELMEEQPGGENHGRKRSPFGTWETLGLSDHKASEDELLPQELAQGPYRRSERDADTIPHGTLGAYKNHGCRCVLCRRANADYVKRSRNVESSNSDEDFR